MYRSRSPATPRAPGRPARRRRRPGARARRPRRLVAAPRPEQLGSLRLKRHSSSRSGGPWLPPPGPCGPREPRPQLGSFKDIYLVRVGGRGGARCAARALRIPRARRAATPTRRRCARSRIRGKSYHTGRARPPGSSLRRRSCSRPAGAAPRRRRSRRGLVDLGYLLVARRRGGIDHVEQQVGVHRLLERGAKRRHQPGGRSRMKPTCPKPPRSRVGQPDAGGVQVAKKLVGLVRLGAASALNSVDLPALV